MWSSSIEYFIFSPGLSAMAEAVTRNPLQLEMVRKHQQIIFVWTDDQNDKDIVKHLKQLGVNGVIYDRMDQNNDKIIKESIFVSTGNNKDNMSSGVSSNGSDYSPLSTPDRSPTRNVTKSSSTNNKYSFSGIFPSN